MMMEPMNMTALWSGVLIGYIILVVGYWPVFEKAGEPGWKAIIPIYNFVIAFEIVGLNPWWVVLLFVPFANIIVIAVFYAELYSSFVKEDGRPMNLFWFLVLFFIFGGTITAYIFGYSKRYSYIGTGGFLRVVME